MTNFEQAFRNFIINLTERMRRRTAQSTARLAAIHRRQGRVPSVVSNTTVPVAAAARFTPRLVREDDR